MDIQAAKELVIKAGKEVVASGLIARTWGNISCRIDENQFVITPSGRPYETLVPEEIVLVNIADCSYDGDVKPSSEKGIHAAAYKMHPEVNFVIHTHQVEASVVSALGFDINNIDEKNKAIIGDNVPVAAYGLPGTPMLRNGVIAAMQRSDSKAIIMAHHGALCLGVDYTDAFSVASALEEVCHSFVHQRFNEIKGRTTENLSEALAYIKRRCTEDDYADVPEFAPCNSERVGDCFTISPVDDEKTVYSFDIASGDLIAGDTYPEAAELHRAIYQKRKDVNYIVQNKSEEATVVSRTVRKMKPLLDDFAQLVGVTVRNAAYDKNNQVKSAKKVVKALKGRNAVLLSNNGALSVAASEYDATAVDMVMDKGCKTQLGAMLFNVQKPICPIEARLMRIIYLKKYSKQAK